MKTEPTSRAARLFLLRVSASEAASRFRQPELNPPHDPSSVVHPPLLGSPMGGFRGGSGLTHTSASLLDGGDNGNSNPELEQNANDPGMERGGVNDRYNALNKRQEEGEIR